MTDNNNSSTIYRLMPSIPDMLFILIFFIILFGGLNLLGDADTGYHIRAGEYIIDNLKIPKHDIFSFISPPINWTAHEWLSEVIFALIHRLSGLTGLVIFSAFLTALTYYILMRHLLSSGAGIIVSAVITTLAAATASIHWLARPHIFSMLLMLIWYIVLDDYQSKKKNRLYLLPLIMLLWVNLHGGFIAGFLLLAIFISGYILSIVFSGKTELMPATKKLSIIFILCGASALINPYGYEILTFPFSLVGNKYIMDNVNEWLSPNFHENMKYEYMLLLLLVLIGASDSGLTAVEGLLILAFTHMSLYSVRYVPLFGIIVSPLIASRAEEILKKLDYKSYVRFFKRVSENTAKTDSMVKGHLLSVLSVIFVIYLSLSGKLQYSFDREKLPVDAVQFMKKERIIGNMFNNDEFGDYIIYSSWPEYKVFFDGRSDMYGVERMREYFKIIRVEDGFEKVLKKYDINMIVFGSESQLSKYLLLGDNWRLIYTDKVANIFLKNTEMNKELIEKYRHVKPITGKSGEI